MDIEQNTLIISLDLELLWGYIADPHHRMAALLKSDRQAGRGVVNSLMRIFERYGVPATWATVGHLFFDVNEDTPYLPDKNLRLLYNGKDIIEMILASSVRHEIGYHSFRHVLFSQCSKEEAETELSKGTELSKRFGLSFKSFAFPKNKVGHVDVLKANGFIAHTGGWVDRSFPGRVKNYLFPPPVSPQWRGIWELRRSMLFCDTSFPFTLVPRARIGAARSGLSNGVFHVYLHPENLLYGEYIARKFEKFLAFAARQRDRKRLRIVTLGDFASSLNSMSGERHDA